MGLNHVVLEGWISNTKMWSYPTGKRKVMFQVGVLIVNKNKSERHTEYIDCETWIDYWITEFEQGRLGDGWNVVVEGSAHAFSGKTDKNEFYKRTYITVNYIKACHKPKDKGENPLSVMGEEVDAGEGLGDW